jgi:hypothetical protein
MRHALLCAAVLLCVSATSFGIVTPTGSGYEVSYNINLSSTVNGFDLTDVLIIESDGANVSVDYPFTINATGRTTLSHELSFEPTSALILGIDPAGAPDWKDHLIMATNDEFAADAMGKLFSQTFSTPRHSHVIGWLYAADSDPAAVDSLVSFFQNEGAVAAFDPHGDFRVLEWTIVVPIDVIPEPTTAITGLMGLAGAGLTALRRRR